MNKFLGALLVGEDEEGNDLGDSGLSVGSSGSLNDVKYGLCSHYSGAKPTDLMIM